MFTGIIERVGRVSRLQDKSGVRHLAIEAGPLVAELRPGDSVCVDGACLTVESAAAEQLEVTAVGATLGRTIAGGYTVGSWVNLERALRADGRLDGHLVQGHVDGLGTLLHGVADGDSRVLRFRLPEIVANTTVEHGSVAINGVSLTVSRLLGPEEIEVAVIPFTWEHTNLRWLQQGDSVNVEGDLIGKYVGKMLAPYGKDRT